MTSIRGPKGELLFTRENLSTFEPESWSLWRKKRLTRAAQVHGGSFAVETREGRLTCEDGYIAIDSEGWPYPIAKAEFERIYEKQFERTFDRVDEILADPERRA
jgi:hypothetical protein